MKKGYAKTYIKVIIGIVIIVLVVVVGMKFVKKEYDTQLIKDIKTDMLLIQAKTKIVNEKVRIKEKDANYVGSKIDDKSEDKTIVNLKEKGILDFSKKENNYYMLNKENLKQLNIESIELNEGFFIVEYNSNDIIYSNGIKDEEGNILYKLSDFENKKQNEEDKKQENSENKENKEEVKK